MRSRFHLAACLFAALPATAGINPPHWQESGTETLWRGRYSNCDHGYVVYLPPGVLAHGNLPPSPNHGFLMPADDAGGSSPTNLRTPRLIDVYDTLDNGLYGSARAYLKFEIKGAHVTNLQINTLRFRGRKAIRARYRSIRNDELAQTDELIVLNHGTFYVIALSSPLRHYAKDLVLYDKIKNGFTLRPIPPGECSND